MVGPWLVGLTVAAAIVGGYAVWRLVEVVRFRLAVAARRRRAEEAAEAAQPVTAERLIKRAEAAMAQLREQIGEPRDPALREQLAQVGDDAADVLTGLRRYADQVAALDRSVHEIPVERLRHDLTDVRLERARAGDDGLRAELDRSVHALEEQLAVFDRLDTSRRTLMARIEGAVFDLEGLGVRVTELIVMHDSAGASDTDSRLSELTGDLEGLRAGLAEADGLSDSILGSAKPAAPVPVKDPAPAAPEPAPEPVEAQAKKDPTKLSPARWHLVGGLVIVVVVVTCLAAAFLPQGGGTSTAADQSTDDCAATLAFIGELSGDNAGDATGERDAIKLAVEQDNAGHSTGCAVRLQQYDTAITGDLAESAALVTREASNVAVIGPTYDSEVTTALPVFQAAGLPAITPSASGSALATKGWTVFHRTLPSDDDQAVAGARYLIDTLKAKRVFVVVDDTDFGVDVAARATKALGHQVVGHASVPETTKDWAPVIKQIKRAGADAIYLGTWSDDGASFMKALRPVLPKITVLSGDKAITVVFRKDSGNSGHGTYATCPCLPVTQGMDVFRAQFSARFGDSPDYYAPEAYDAAQIALAGIRAGITTRPEMLKFVDSWDEEGLARHIAFGPGGGLAVKEPNVWAYQSGSDGYFVPKAAISTLG